MMITCRLQILASLIALLIILATACSAEPTSYKRIDQKHHWFMPNHPRLRRISKAMGIGLVTGGLAAPILGAGVATGAIAGAAEHGTVRAVKDSHDMKKHGKLDHHIW